MKKALIIANMLFASSTVFGMFQFGGNAPDAESQSNTSGFTFRAPVNQSENQVQITCVEEGSTQTEILRMEERAMQTENPEILNNDLQNAFLSYINSKGQATDIMLWAAKSNQSNIIDYLIKNNVNVNGAINGQNSLYQAVFNKNLELADHLILNGAKFNTNDKENLLFNAIETNNMETVKYLIDKKVNIGYIRNYNRRTESFLDLAVSKKHFDIAKYLIENGAEVRNLQKHQVLSFVIENGSLDLVKHFISKGVDVNLVDGYKRTLLHNAVLFNKYDIAEYLVNNERTIINAQDNNAYTPLLYAVEKKHTDIAELLIKKLAEKDDTGNALNYLMGRANGLQKTPLYEASQNGSLDIVKLLAENKADLKKRASNRVSPTEIAIQNNHTDIAKYLIEHGVNVNETDKDGRGLLSQAIVTNSEGSVDFAKYLIEKGAKINRQSNDGWTPLHEAVQTGNKEMVQLLIDHDAFVNATDKLGWTPLHEASQRGNFEIFKLLADNGADINASCGDSTPMSIAYRYGYSSAGAGRGGRRRALGNAQSRIVEYLNNKSSRFTSNRLAVHNK